MSHPSELDAVLAFATALAVTALLTPLTMRVAGAVGAIDRPRARGLSDRSTPLLGGLAIFAGALVAGLVWLPAGYGGDAHLWQGVLLAAGVVALVGALDDRFELPPAVKLAGQVLAAIIVVHFGVAVKAITLPFIGTLHFPNAGATNAGPVLTVIGLVLMMNVVNFSDGVDGLAAGVCVIIAAAMAVIAFDLSRQQPGVLAALTAGAALGFLIYNFPPASSFMGDCGANLLGLLMGCITVEAAVKTAAVVSFVLPLILLAVPFVPYSDHKGHLNTGWTLVMAALGLVAVASSVYLVYVLEILKFRRLDTMRLRRLRPDASPAEIARDVARDLETGEFQAVTRRRADADAGGGAADGRALGAQQRIGQRQVDEERVGAQHERGGAQA